MGYTTEFTGVLKFDKELGAKALAKLQTFMGEDCREHRDWDADGTYIDLRITKDFSGIEWDDETEKNNGMVSHVNLIIKEMKKDFPDFGLNGVLIAQGEDHDDRWCLKIENGEALRDDIKVVGEEVSCPHCKRKFKIQTFD